MKKFEVLRAVVVLQALCMIALTGAVMVKVWPLPQLRGDEGPAVTPPVRSESGGSGHSGGAVGRMEEAAAQIGGRTITKGEVAEELFRQYGDKVLREMMLRTAVELEAGRHGLTVTSAELDRALEEAAEGYDGVEQYLTIMKDQLGMDREQVLDDLRCRLLMDKIAAMEIPVSDEDVQAFMKENPGQFGPSEQLHLRWIVSDSEEGIGEIMRRLENGEDFAELARAYSVDEFTAELGGDLGVIEADDPYYADALEATAGLQIGEVVGPVPASGGYAAVQLLGRTMKEGLSGVELEEAVRRRLALEKAPPLALREEQLLARYGAVVVK